MPQPVFSESGDEADDEKEKSGSMGPLSVQTTTRPVEVPGERTCVKTLRLTSEELVCWIASKERVWFLRYNCFFDKPVAFL